MNSLRATHVITSLDADGAQGVLLRLLRTLGTQAAAMDVISMRPLGPLAEEFRALGIRVRSLNMRRGVPRPRAALELIAMLRRDRPAVLVTWLYHANLLGAFAHPFIRRVPLVWNVRNDRFAPYKGGRGTAATIRLCTLLSKWAPHRIVFCAASSLAFYCGCGYPAKRSLLVPNGFDSDRFQPCDRARIDVRRELHVRPDTPLVGRIGRYHPDKDYETFLAAAARVAAERPDVRFLLCGRDVTADNRTLAASIASCGLREHCHLLGTRDDVPRLAAALDLGVSSSATEAFSNTIGEIMASAVPCVVTDVGDSAVVVGECGRVVPPREAEPLARACLELLALPPGQRQQIGDLARKRIEETYSLRAMTEQHYRAWSAAVDEHRGTDREIREETENRKLGRAA